jgi:hypothetical protein
MHKRATRIESENVISLKMIHHRQNPTVTNSHFMTSRLVKIELVIQLLREPVHESVS